MMIFGLYFFVRYCDLLEVCYFLTRERERGSGTAGQGGRKKLGGEEGRKIVIWIYCKRKKLVIIKK